MNKEKDVKEVCLKIKNRINWINYLLIFIGGVWKIGIFKQMRNYLKFAKMQKSKFLILELKDNICNLLNRLFRLYVIAFGCLLC